MQTPRKDGTWNAFLADLSLDRARPLLSPIGVPTDDTQAFSLALQTLEPPPAFGTRFAGDLEPRLASALDERFGHEARARLMAWMAEFPCDADDVLPAPWYWRHRFTAMRPDAPPAGVDPAVWHALIAVWRGRPSASNLPEPFREAAVAAQAERDRIGAVLRTLEDARRAPSSAFDLKVYLRFGWNDHGDIKGLSTIETGLMNVETIETWRHCAALFDSQAQEAIEAWALAEDLAGRQELLSHPEDFAEDAARYGRTVEEVMADLFPPPPPAPKLTQLLGRGG